MTTTARRWARASPSNRSSMTAPALLALEEDRAVDDDAVTRLHPGQHRDHLARARADRHVASLVLPGAALDEHDALAVFLHERRHGNHRGLPDAPRVPDVAEHLGAEPTLGIRELDVD